MNCDTM